jgi:hypothetical protein
MHREDSPDARIDEALRKRALGYETVEEREIVEEDDNGKRKTKTERIRKMVPPDLEAIKLMRAYRAQDEEGVITVVTQAPRPGASQGVRKKRASPGKKTGGAKKTDEPKETGGAKKTGEPKEPGEPKGRSEPGDAQ